MDYKKKYHEMKSLEKSMDQIEARIYEIDDKLAEVSYILQSLTSLKGKDGNPSLIPVSNGIFVKGTIEKTEEFFINVGKGVVVKKSLEETKEMMQRQEKELEEYRMDLVENLNELTTKVQNIESEL